MNKLLTAGLCTILLATPTIVSGQDKPKNKLETITQQAPYIGPDGNYSININPEYFKSLRPIHTIRADGYKDSYPAMPGHIPGVLVIERMQVDGNIRDIYDAYKAMYIDVLSKSMSKSLAPGEKIAYANNVPSINITVDNKPAIQGNVRVMVTDAAGNEVKQKLKYNLMITVAKDNKNVYGFLNYCLASEGTDAIVYRNYSNILKNFHILK